MMLIDRDAYPCKDCGVQHCRENCGKFNDWLNTPVRYDIVRCKDCEYFCDRNRRCPMCYWVEDDEFGMETLINNADPEWFCSEGRRKKLWKR